MRKKYPFIYIHIYDISYNCCKITGVDAKMKDGVLRMIVSRVKVKDHGKKCTHTLPPNTGSNTLKKKITPFLFFVFIH